MASNTKRYSYESLSRRRPLQIIAALGLAGAMFMQSRIDPLAKARHIDDVSLETTASGLNSEFLILPLLGFREAAAGLLWVRCDEFFHSGDYDAILPLVRLITWLDPHADNIFITGAWHLAYNFTDSSERSDRRYIAPSQALLKEGVAKNPDIPDIRFELGWQNYDKIKDYQTAVDAFVLALNTKPNPKNEEFPYGAPLKVWHILAHAYEKQGRIPEAIATWEKAMERTAAQLKKTPDDFSVKSMRAAEEHNRDENLSRYRDRYLADPSMHSKINPTKYPFVLAPPGGKGEPRPWNMTFKPQVEITRAKVFKIKGQANMADGGRIDVRLTDWDYKERPLDTGKLLEKFDVDQTVTIMQDAISVRKNRFDRELDLSKDPKMYSFSTDSYKLTLTFNARTTAPHVQDRFGYSGEGMTTDDPRFVMYDTRPSQLGTMLIEGQGGTGNLWDGKTIPVYQPDFTIKNADGSLPAHGQPARLIRVTYKISKEQIQGLKPLTDKDIVPNN